MRRTRMLGLAVIAVLGLVAVGATSATAGTVKNPTKSLKIFQNCPIGVESSGEYGSKEVDQICIFGATEAPPEGGAFTVGPITTPFSKQVQLQLGLVNFLAGVGGGEKSEENIAPVDGAQEIVPTPERVPGEPIAHISEAEQNEEGWPVALKYSYDHAKKSSLKKVYETIEVAGTPRANSLNLVLEEGVAVEAPVKVKGENAWIATLGDVCYIGSDAEPITQHLTSGPSESPLTGEVLHGYSGELSAPQEGREVISSGSDLVDNTYAVPGASCTGPYSTYIDAAIDHAFGIPAAAGASNTQLKGTLYIAEASLVEEKLGL